MKKLFYITVIILIIIPIEKKGQSKVINDDIITVDVRKNYSSKKDLTLQDFMDVEYIMLETKDGFYTQGEVLDVSKNYIIVRNRVLDGDIFIFNRNGKAICKINRMGQGPGEYTSWSLLGGIRINEDNNEIILYAGNLRTFIVYDLSGKFKRSFKQKEKTISSYNSTYDSPFISFYRDVFNYNNDNLICNYVHIKDGISFEIISKQDAGITKEIYIPYKEQLLLQHRDATAYPGFPIHTMIPYNDNWLLSEISTDTIFTLLQDYTLRPFIVRTPSIQSMEPKVFLLLRLMSSRYYFMETIKIRTVTDYPQTFFVYDTQEKGFFSYKVYNGDYTIKREIIMNRLFPVNHEIASWQKLEAFQLIESYKKGELKDNKLKEIAAKLNEEDNPVIMLVKHKK